MMKLDLLNYGIHCGSEHIADVDDLDHAKFFANAMAINTETNTLIIDNFTGEVVAEFVVKQRIEVIEVEP